MCLILIAVKSHPQYDLILLANRDEYYSRPSAQACFWKNLPYLLAGRDLQAGGTWLGITRSGKIAALTNYRDPASHKANAPSRGLLVKEFLQNTDDAEHYLENIMGRAPDYNGFNLILGERDRLFYYSNRFDHKQSLSPGLYGLSNHLLKTPWPKVLRGKDFLKDLISEGAEFSLEKAFQYLLDDRMPEDKDLPDTGVGLERERMLSPIFIASPDYGTRSSTILLIDKHDWVTFAERIYDPGKSAPSTVQFKFRLKAMR